MSLKIKQNDVYKEFPNQNFIEVRFNGKSFDQLSSEEAYTRYKNNVIFLYLKIPRPP